MDLMLVFSLLALFCLHGVSSDSHKFTSLFTLGDSLTDTGNLVIMATPDVPVYNNKPPYGMTFFGHPTGRFSDGRVPIDFIAEQFGLPLLRASLQNSSDVSKGLNFAVGGATAIDVNFFERNKIVPFKLLNNSLDVQLGWFEQLRPAICNKAAGQSECFSNALFFVGEFGVNDYNLLASDASRGEDAVKSYVPTVVGKISSAVETHQRSVVYVVVPGMPPTGCSPSLLATRLSLNKPSEYDHIGCLSDVNRVAMHHNSLLRAAVGTLRNKYPQAKIILADFYNPIITLLEKPSRFGIAGGDTLKACCGSGGKYNWNVSTVCGTPGVAACKDPSRFVSWDGTHYTEATYRYIAKGWLDGPYAEPSILSVA